MKSLFSLVLLCSCSISPFEGIQEQVLKQNERLRRKYHLDLVGVGLVGPGEIKAIVLDQNVSQEPTIDEARILLVNYIEDLKHLVNKNFEKTNSHAPIDETFFSIAINFYDPLGILVQRTGKVTRVSQNDGRVRYKILKNELLYETVYEETYQDALKAVSRLTVPSNN